MATRPNDVPRWATTGGRVEPPEGKKDTGWENGEKPPAGFFNWLSGLVGDWLGWLQATLGETLDGRLLLGPTAIYNGSDTGLLPLEIRSDNGSGVYIRSKEVTGDYGTGVALTADGAVRGVAGIKGIGSVHHHDGAGVRGEGYIGVGGGVGVSGKGTASRAGVYGEGGPDGHGVHGVASAAGDKAGVRGEGAERGVHGSSPAGEGVRGSGTIGVHGLANGQGGLGVIGDGSIGVEGRGTYGEAVGVKGFGGAGGGVVGQSASGPALAAVGAGARLRLEPQSSPPSNPAVGDLYVRAVPGAAALGLYTGPLAGWVYFSGESI